MKLLLPSLALLMTATAFGHSSDPQKYAAELSQLLTEYQKQLAIKIAAEQQAYQSAAQLYDEAFRQHVFASLTLDRQAQANSAARSLTARTLTPDKLLDQVLAYSFSDFNQTRSIYGLGLDSYKTYGSNVIALQADSRRVTVLIQILDDLAQPLSLQARLQQLQSYQKNFVQQLHFSDCSLADSLVSINSTKLVSVQTQLAATNAKIAGAASTDDISALAALKQMLTADQQTLQEQIATLTAKRASTGSFVSDGSASGGTCQVK